MFYNKLKIIFLLFLLSSCADDNINNSNIDELSEDEFIFGDSNNLNIVTWNIEHFPKTHNTVTYLTDLMKSINVDIFALQEIESLDSLNALKNNLGDNWVAYRAPGDSYYGNLAYLINTTSITPIGVYNVLDSNDELLFNYRLPYVLEFSFQGENFVLIKIFDNIENSENKIFQGWMISSSPSASPFEHPIYDIWLKDCNID